MAKKGAQPERVARKLKPETQGYKSYNRNKSARATIGLLGLASIGPSDASPCTFKVLQLD